MVTFKRISDYQKQFIRNHSAKMYASNIAEILKMHPDTVRKFIKYEGLKAFQPVKKKRYGRDKKEPDNVKSGFFNVSAQNNWLVNG